ncbi:MAG: tetratricopeptide repeat protein, partial [Vampirovibrionia bacterium]
MFKKIFVVGLLILLSGCQQAVKTPPELHKEDSIQVNEEVKDANLSKDDQIQFKQGNYFLTKGDYVNAIRKFLYVIKGNPKFAQAHYNLGVAYFETNRPEEAVKEWQDTLKYDPDYTKAYLSLGYAYEQLSNNTQAVEYYDKYIQLKPDDPNVKVILDKINKLRGLTVGQGIIGRVVIADDVNPETYQTDHPKDVFSDDKDIIYTTAEIGDAPK